MLETPIPIVASDLDKMYEFSDVLDAPIPVVAFDLDKEKGFKREELRKDRFAGTVIFHEHRVPLLQGP